MFASPDHPIHNEPEPLAEETRLKYRGIAIADTAKRTTCFNCTVIR